MRIIQGGLKMREMLFRGKRKGTGEWVYGFYAPYRTIVKTVQHRIYTGEADKVDGQLDFYPDFYPDFYNVIPETVGQYTGLTDKNGLTKIFEYDIIDANGRKVGNYYENSNLLKDGTCFLVARMGTKEWSRSEQEAIKRGCKYAE